MVQRGRECQFLERAGVMACPVSGVNGQVTGTHQIAPDQSGATESAQGGLFDFGRHLGRG